MIFNNRKPVVHHWPSFAKDFDSINSRLEQEFLEFATPDTLDHHIRLLDSICEHTNSNQQSAMKSQVYYWKAKYATAYSSHEQAYQHIRKAISITDTSRYQYQKMRYLTTWMTLDDQIDIATKHDHFKEALSYARKIKDAAYEAGSATNLGNILGFIGEYNLALSYNLYSDSINKILGYEKLRAKNLINRSNILKFNGHPQESDSILRALLDSPMLKGDTLALNIILYNLYAGGEEVGYLHGALKQIKDIPRFKDRKVFYYALLAKHHIESETWDSAEYYANLSFSNLAWVSNYKHRELIWETQSILYANRNQLDSALLCRVEYENYRDSVIKQENTKNILKSHAIEQIRNKERLYKQVASQRNWIILISVVVLFGGGGIGLLLVNRRNLRQRLLEVKRELELEQALRKLAATTLTIEQKDMMLGTLREELSELRKEGEIREGSSRRLESSIKAHMSEHEVEETFRDMFDTVHPGFTERLRERCPDLADSYVKLASYLLMELDNKKIASLMRIKPESVHQARWRLRRRLNIPEGMSLEEFLRKLNKAM